MLRTFNPEYFLTLICKDNEGSGNTAFASLIVNFRKALKIEYVGTNKTFYVLASGPDGTDIPYLALKV